MVASPFLYGERLGEIRGKICYNTYSHHGETIYLSQRNKVRDGPGHLSRKSSIIREGPVVIASAIEWQYILVVKTTPNFHLLFESLEKKISIPVRDV